MIYKPYKEQLLQVDSIHQVSFSCYGNNEAPSIFLFHGGPGYGFSSEMLDPFDLSDWNIIAIDQRGCGKSQPRGCVNNNTTNLLVEDIKKIADYLGIKRFSIKGESWGTTLALVFAEKYPQYVVSMILTGVFLGNNSGTLIGKNGGFENFFPEYWKDYIELLPSDKRDNPYPAYYEYIINGNPSEQERYARQLIFLELITEMPFPDPERANRICDTLDCKSIAKIESFYTMNDFFIEEGQIEKAIKSIAHIPITIVQGRHDFIVPIKSAWLLSQIHPNCKLIISELQGHSDTTEQTALILKEVAKMHLSYWGE